MPLRALQALSPGAHSLSAPAGADRRDGAAHPAEGGRHATGAAGDQRSYWLVSVTSRSLAMSTSTGASSAAAAFFSSLGNV